MEQMGLSSANLLETVVHCGVPKIYHMAYGSVRPLFSNQKGCVLPQKECLVYNGHGDFRPFFQCDFLANNDSCFESNTQLKIYRTALGHLIRALDEKLGIWKIFLHFFFDVSEHTPIKFQFCSFSHSGYTKQEDVCKPGGHVAYEHDSRISHPLSLHQIPCKNSRT